MMVFILFRSCYPFYTYTFVVASLRLAGGASLFSLMKKVSKKIKTILNSLTLKQKIVSRCT